ncbi:hypothetical protein CTI12_AA197300 [Artemisia annua]|uniref:Uncharacterized protein n=1 Tax=Artemisia annua TaxID=35608 RepID=A0A2U1P395_ARTAN|nr:hypothetical protein CTI12_AA197300 [Artemisia annua]
MNKYTNGHFSHSILSNNPPTRRSLSSLISHPSQISHTSTVLIDNHHRNRNSTVVIDRLHHPWHPNSTFVIDNLTQAHRHHHLCLVMDRNPNSGTVVTITVIKLVVESRISATALEVPRNVLFIDEKCIVCLTKVFVIDVMEYECMKEMTKYLIATAEQPLCAYHKDDLIGPKELPIRYIYLRWQFQLKKVLLKRLKLPYQVVEIVSGALNDAAAKKYDLEAWFPASAAYRELVSCSNL